MLSPGIFSQPSPLVALAWGSRSIKDPLFLFGDTGRQVYGGGGFSDAAFLIGDSNDLGFHRAPSVAVARLPSTPNILHLVSRLPHNYFMPCGLALTSQVATF